VSNPPPRPGDNRNLIFEPRHRAHRPRQRPPMSTIGRSIPHPQIGRRLLSARFGPL